MRGDFLSAHLYVCVCVYVCPPLRLLITSDLMWHDMDFNLLVKQVLLQLILLYLVHGHGLTIEVRCIETDLSRVS